MLRHAPNSLDLLRLLAAWAVLFSHQHALLGLAEPSFLGLNTFGGAGVWVFFFLSGSLVWGSWCRDPHWLRYLARRSLRVLPGLWVVVALTLLVLGPLASSLKLREYFTSTLTLRFTLNLVLFIQNTLPGVFEQNPYPVAVNGSLWTLPVEFFCYLQLAAFGALRLGTRRLSPCLAAAAAALACSVLGPELGSRFAPHLEVMTVFWFGAAYGEIALKRASGALPSRLEWSGLVIAALVFGCTSGRGLERLALLVVAACLVHWAASVRWGELLTRPLGDASYGVYIYAFPVQQALAHWLPGAGFAQQLLLSSCLTLVLAAASWRLVEQRALLLKPGGGA